MAQLLWKVNQ